MESNIVVVPYFGPQRVLFHSMVCTPEIPDNAWKIHEVTDTVTSLRNNFGMKEGLNNEFTSRKIISWTIFKVVELKVFFKNVSDFQIFITIWC